jgi:hypothetical protein
MACRDVSLVPRRGRPRVSRALLRARPIGFFGSPSPAVARPTAFATENCLSDLTLVSTRLWLRIYESYRELLPVSLDTKFGCFMEPEVTNAEAET